MDACRPLRPHDRNAFLIALSIELERERQLGPGVVHRTCRNLQRQFFNPPNLSGSESKIRVTALPVLPIHFFCPG